MGILILFGMLVAGIIMYAIASNAGASAKWEY